MVMSNHNDKDEPEWMRRLKSEGAVPMLEPENCPNGWSSPSGDIFKVRGPEYFSNKVKIPAGEYLLKPLAFDWIKSSSKITEIMNNPNSRIRTLLDTEFPQGSKNNKPFVWAFNLQVPTKENYSAVAYFTSPEEFPEGSLVDQFLKSDDGVRTSRLKFIANVIKGPWFVRKAVGEQAICIIGRTLSCKYCVGENFLEVDIDIGSSVVANAIVHLAFGYITFLTVDLAFLIESQTEEELPERILGAFRFSELQPDSAVCYEVSSSVFESGVDSSPALGMRFWKSIGQGFSNLLHTGGNETGSDSGSQHGNVDDDNSKEVTEVKCVNVSHKKRGKKKMNQKTVASLNQILSKLLRRRCDPVLHFPSSSGMKLTKLLLHGNQIYSIDLFICFLNQSIVTKLQKIFFTAQTLDCSHNPSLYSRNVYYSHSEYISYVCSTCICTCLDL